MNMTASQEYLEELQKKHQLPFSADHFKLLTDKGQHYIYKAAETDTGKNYIIRLPKSTENNPIIKELERESAVTQIIAQHDLGVSTSNVKMFYGEQPFAYHNEIEGTLLTKDVYDNLSESKKDIFAKDIAYFLHKLHSIPIEKLKDVPPQENPKSLSNDFLKNQFDYALAKNLLNKYGINLDAFKTDISEDKVLCHNDLHGENLTVYSQDSSNSPNDHVLKGVFDFGNADISNRSFDFIKLININRGLGRNIINQYNEISPHKVSQKEADYQYLCWQAQNLIIYDTALKNINKDKQNNQISSQKYDEFMARYNKFERLTSDKLASFRIDVARERSENRRNKDTHELSSKDHTAEKAPFKKDMIKDRTTFIKNIISEKNYQK